MTTSDMNISHEKSAEELGVKRLWGQAIRRQRRFIEMTQAELAKAVGVDQSAVSGWESGRIAPTVDRQLAIAIALRIDARVLFAYPQQVA